MVYGVGRTYRNPIGCGASLPIPHRVFIGNTHLRVWNIPHIGGVGRDTLLCEPNWNVHQNLKSWFKTKTTSYLESIQLGSSYAAHVVLLGLVKEVVHITQITTFCTCTTQKVLIWQCVVLINNLQSQAIRCVCTSGIGVQIQLSFKSFWTIEPKPKLEV